jgi:hypothetical protein
VNDDANLCDRCGAFGDMPHAWVEGDCILPHDNHSTRLASGAHVCVHCIDRHIEWLTEIVELYAGLCEVVLAGSIPDDTAAHSHKKAAGSPSPLRLAAWALIEGVNDHTIDVDYSTGVRVETVRDAYLGPNLPDVPAVLTGWAQAALDEQYENATAPSTVAGAAAVLQTHATVMARLPDIDTYDAELRWVRRSLRAAHAISDPQPLGRCLTTTCRGLVWRQAEGSPECDRCRRRYAKLDLVRLKAHEKITRERA